MTFAFDVPTQDGPLSISLERGSTVIFVGANGAGKTRLAAQIESSLGEHAHRIAAHRALALNPDVAKVSESAALAGLRFGYANAKASVGHRQSHRWSQKVAVSLLNDFDFLLQALFAEQSNTALRTHTAVRRRTLEGDAKTTRFEILQDIWERLLPTRQLQITGDNVSVLVANGPPYSASEMSDGERAVFYMLGQALVAAADSVLVVDEPELHVHPSIMGPLWDEVQAARPDCGLIFITHDLTFAATQLGQKFVVRNYAPTPVWTVERVPEDTGFSEELVTLILGSRRPVLFVEGTSSSIDAAMYRACFPEWTVISRGSCEEVIHSVVTMRRNASLTRVTCCGLVDADDYTADETERMQELNVAVLPVSEIENLVLLPDVSRTILAAEAFSSEELEQRLTSLRDDLLVH